MTNHDTRAAEEDADHDDVDEAGLETLLEYLHRKRGFDFGSYKRPSLTRRLRRRMTSAGIDAFGNYVDYLEVHPDEFQQLFDALLINVTGFYRDEAAWEGLESRIGEIVDTAGDAPIRVWSAGCASGEEPYTIAMLLCDALGESRFVDRVKIYATDIDEDALQRARQAVYSQRVVEHLSAERVERYFGRIGSQYGFRKELRRCVIFGRHDLLQGAPIPRVDVLVCRNTLMYFNAEAQRRILGRLHFALNPAGVLFLGVAEMLLLHADLFTPVDMKLRLFGKTTRTVRRERAVIEPATVAPRPPKGDAWTRVYQVAFDAGPVAQVIIDPAGRMLHANRRATDMFGLDAADVGRAFHELELSYRPAELRSCLDRVRMERRSVQLTDVECAMPGGDVTYLDIDIAPLPADASAFLGSRVSFVDVTAAHRLQADLRQANVELATAHQELQSTSEELETTHEELQSTVEELETTNEELQSTNEELETMNTELQATNEELRTINEELRYRGSQLNETNAFYGAILGSFNAGIAVLDEHLRVLTWNSHMEELWGVRSEEVVTKHFLNLDIGLPVADIAQALQACLTTRNRQRGVYPSTNRHGKQVSCQVELFPLRSELRGGVLVVVNEEAS